MLSNPLLLWGIAFELAFAAALIYLPPLQPIFGTAALGPGELALLAAFPAGRLGRRRGTTPSPAPRGAPHGAADRTGGGCGNLTPDGGRITEALTPSAA